MNKFWSGKRVLVTGHTGFKGSWLSAWLLKRGAVVTGIALEPDGTQALFDQLDIAGAIDHHIEDIRDAGVISRIVKSCSPEVVFHLAAQPLVLRSYADPLETWSTNVMGTAHLLDALRAIDHRCAAVIVTTDKVYQNNEWEFGYRETDRLGGHDPYSSSKAATEIACATWRSSFFNQKPDFRLASARAGNVIGGGDWSENRIIPDLARALDAGEPVTVRNPGATRPWQHVLDPLYGYIQLAERLFNSDDPKLEDAFNFGPSPEAQRPVRDLIETALKYWPGKAEFHDPDPGSAHEAGKLALNIERAKHLLDWSPIWDFETAVSQTMAWYQAAASGADMRAATHSQLEQFENAVRTSRN